MKALAESILSRSGHSGKETMNRLIRGWLDEYGVENYTINDDFTIDVNGYVNLVGKDLTEFPEYIQFGVVRGDFNCSGNSLVSLRGCPREVRLGSFLCNDNQLTSLEGVPKKVDKIFDCSNNELTSLKGVPENVGGSFYCTLNKLTSLEGAPKKVGGHFGCSHNKLTSLRGAPRKTRVFDCSHNKLTSLKGAPKEVTGFVCSNNTTTFTVEDIKRVCDIKRDTLLIK